MRFGFLIPLFLIPSCADANAPASPPQQQQEAQARQERPVLYGYRIIATYPHDKSAFTQGLFWRDGHLWESTGQIGESSIRKVRLEDGKVLKSVPIPPPFFGEGITPWEDEIISLTWQHGTAFRWNAKTLRKKGEFTYPGEGWGITNDGKSLIMSDGSAELRFLNPDTFAEQRTITVTANGQPVMRLNELEWVRGEIFANVWQTGFIVRIDPETGNVTGIIDLRPLAAEMGQQSDNVLNGIAWDEANGRLFITGKYWDKLFQIELFPSDPAP